MRHVAFGLLGLLLSAVLVAAVPRYWDILSVPSSPATYSPGALYRFNSSWNETNGTVITGSVANVTFETNITTNNATMLNFTILTTPAVSNISTRWTINFTDRPAGGYAFRWYAINETGFWNSTATIAYITNKAGPPVRLLIDGNEAGKTIETGQVVNFTAVHGQSVLFTAAGGPTLQISDNDSSIGTPSNTSVQSNVFYTNVVLLGAIFHVRANVTGNQNYTDNASGVLRLVTVIDSRAPSGAFLGYTNDTPVKNGASLFLDINITDNDDTINNCTIRLGNSSTIHEIIPSLQASNIVMTQGAINSMQHSCNKTVTIPSDLGADGSKVINVTVRDRNSTNTDFILTRTFKLDNTLPTGSLSLDRSSIDTGASITPACTSSDANGASNSLSVTKPDNSVATATCGSAFTADISGTYTFRLTITDGAGNAQIYTATATASARSSDAGGGGTTPVKEPSQAAIFSMITPGAAAIFKVTNEEIGIKQVTIEVSNEANSVRVEVKKLEGKPAEVTKEIEGKAYQYFRINAENAEGKVREGRVAFNVEKSWLNSNSVNKDHILMRRFSGGVWQDLKTTVTGEDSGSVSYEAVTPGFSVFVISVSVPVTTPSEAAIVQTPTEKETTTTLQVPEEKIPEGGSTGIMLLIVVALLAALFYFNSKKGGARK